MGFGAEKEARKKEDGEDYREKVLQALKDGFRPEFLHRIDEIIIFNPLGMRDIEKIVDIQLTFIEKRLS